MNRILYLMIILIFGVSKTILIVEAFQAIQDSIDASVDGETVFISNRNYV